MSGDKTEKKEQGVKSMYNITPLPVPLTNLPMHAGMVNSNATSPIVIGGEAIAMSSREIAEPTGMRHANVRRTIMSLISVTQFEEPTVGGALMHG